MLLPVDKVITEKVKDIVHIGAHLCEEKKYYGNRRVIWIDANKQFVDLGKKEGNEIYQAVVSEKDNETVVFNVTTNKQSSSILNLKEHAKEYPTITVCECKRVKTITFDTFVKTHNLDISNCNFLNIDIQGAELLALKGMEKSLSNFDFIYLEVNEKEMYENCALVAEIDEYLEKRGYIRKITAMTNKGWGDALYVKMA